MTLLPIVLPEESPLATATAPGGVSPRNLLVRRADAARVASKHLSKSSTCFSNEATSASRSCTLARSRSHSSSVWAAKLRRKSSRCRAEFARLLRQFSSPAERVPSNSAPMATKASCRKRRWRCWPSFGERRAIRGVRCGVDVEARACWEPDGVAAPEDRNLSAGVALPTSLDVRAKGSGTDRRVLAAADPPLVAGTVASPRAVASCENGGGIGACLRRYHSTAPP
mmetsp:Transcript_63388/g.138009  ORF Transcript_63388/g.138009 Transcript_63388/m.138009 type:complete len:226 (+) Transcript_63388:915-1592(+)